ncbi:MAG: SDR family NAD(P)-dependent oxidoreductase [Bacteroidetes bacterium]|jgi:NAD(P)-dependent dehydrogenase (short-subunit alcohol dehydrogenase family)|nr:SDR family NAD(P)-dependent oxidoreductase [Bacteroidota bacterium]
MNKELLRNILPAARMIFGKHTKPAIITYQTAENGNAESAIQQVNSRYVKIIDESEEKVLQQLRKAKTDQCEYILFENDGIAAISDSKRGTDQLLYNLFPDPNGQSAQLTNNETIINTRMNDKIVIITGGAQGFGGGIARELFAWGANIVIADLNEEKGMEMAETLNMQGGRNKAVFVKTNVADPVSVASLIDQSVLYFGGLDAIISNAGILRAGGLDEMTPETFDQMTKVNYTGFFYCAKYASQVLKKQHTANPDYYTDIIQINSKSGLKGSNKNFAYAGGKFGGIGLTQSFALELMPYKIKVNAICPGNFFDGPLWSDPENGLFAQYLKTGKVPGAQSIDEVKKHYESQVPAGRGCEVKDVVKAILYAIDQEYETGQAIPVTGGQNMLK